MGIFDFNKDAGEAFKNDGPDARQFDQHLQEKLKRYNYQVEGLAIHHENGEVTISGQAPDQDTREKIILAIGNSKGVHRVNDQMKVNRKQDTPAQKQTTASDAQYTSSETDYKTGSSEEVGGTDYKGPSTTGIHKQEETQTNKKDGKKPSTAPKSGKDKDEEEELVKKPVAKGRGKDEELIDKPVAKGKKGKDDDEELVDKPVAKGKKGKDDDEELVDKPVAKGRKGGDDDDDDDDLVHKPIAKGQSQNKTSSATENVPTKKEAPPGYKGPVNRKGYSDDDDDLVEKPQFYTVEDGDDLDKIASKHYGDAKHHQKIIEANNPMLTKSSELYPGQVLRIPRSNRESD